MKQTKKTDKPKFKKREFEIKLLSDNAILPKKAVRGSIGYDLCVPSDFRVPAHSRVAIPLDIAINLPNGIEGKIEPRSGCSLRGIEGYGSRTIITGKILGIFPKKKILSGKLYFDADVCVGKVDPNYTDNIHVILINRDESFLIRKGSRIAQLTFYQTIAPFFKVVEELTCKSRGGGLGHTGVDRLHTTLSTVKKDNQEEELHAYDTREESEQTAGEVIKFNDPDDAVEASEKENGFHEEPQQEDTEDSQYGVHV